MSIANVHDMGAYIKTVKGHSPKNASSETINGAAIERTDFKSCKLHAACGAASGAPTAQTVNSKLQQSADGATGWTDITDAAVTEMTGDDEEETVDVDLGSADAWIRVVTVIVLTAGTTPALAVASSVSLGGAMELPAA